MRAQGARTDLLPSLAEGSLHTHVERRGQAELDPIRKARIAGFLKEYWDVQRGNPLFGHNVPIAKTVGDIAGIIGESPKTTQRLMKLNDLIPQLQRLVSEGRLGTTAAEQLAYFNVPPFACFTCVSA